MVERGGMNPKEKKEKRMEKMRQTGRQSFKLS